jgi:GNAT superfamily N-acetyltransferase
VTYSTPVPLAKQHDASGFDCGKEAINKYLKQHAAGNQTGGAARTYVVANENFGPNAIAGYYSLAPAAVRLQEAPERVRKGQAQHPVPCILLARLAVDRRCHGQGLGRSLFRDALLRALSAHDQIGGRAFLVHAMDEEARRFYERYGMLPSPSDPLHLFLLFKDIRNLLR